MRALARLTALLLTLAAPSAHAEWREASSDHFIIYADANEAWLRKFADKLERFDAAIRTLRGIADPPEQRSNRLVIYVVDEGSKANQLCGRDCGSVAGFYVPRAGGSIAFTERTSGGGALDLKAETVLFHEYTHHFLLANYTRPVPLWFGEGFAEFHATAKIGDDGSVIVGNPANHRAMGLRVGDPIPIEALFEPPVKRTDPQFWDVFYGRAWLLTHMLTFGSDRPQQLAKYLTLLDEGKGGVAAAEAAFGDLKALNREMNRALNKPFAGKRLSAEALKVGAIVIRALSPGESAMMDVRMRSDRGVDRKAALALVPVARRKAAPHPNDARVQAMLAEVEYDAGNFDEAEAAADRALAADPKHQDALLYKGRVLMARAAEAKATDPKVWQRARSWFVRANRLDPNAAEPLMLNYQSYLAAREQPTENTVRGLMRAVELSPQARELRFMAAMQMLRDDKPKDARVLLQPLAADPHARGGTNLAAAIVAKIDAGEKAAAIAEGAEAESDQVESPPPQ
jgi:tetratricopeptide (TPR) repeat protein